MADEVVFKNNKWTVYKDRMEHADPHYVISENIDGRRGPHWEWPMQVGIKTWCDVTEFAPAFLALLEAMGIKPDSGLLMSFFRLGQDDVEHKVYVQTEKDVFGERQPVLNANESGKVMIEARRRLGK